MFLNSFLPGRPVLIDGGTGAAIHADDIKERSEELLALTKPRALAFLLADNTLASVRDFHALVHAGIPVALLDKAIGADTIHSLAARYRPELVLAPIGNNYESMSALPSPEYKQVVAGVWTSHRTGPKTHPDLAVLLTTSGSTGSPKFVRLSRINISSNARQIAASLEIMSDDRGITALPFHYSFGMSILTSHATVGSPVVVTSASVLETVLWDQVTEHRVSFFPGVPQTFQILRRLRFATSPPNSLRALIQAGGRLDPAVVAEFADLMLASGGQFFVMYGQTEAAPRMACLPPGSLPNKAGAAGVALKGGRIETRGPEGDVLPPGEVGEIHYTGPNVMMGYAESREDLELGDVQGDTLATGDLGFLDEEGFVFVTGRNKRLAKLAGIRISLDEVEAMAPELSGAAVECPSGTITIATEVADVNGSHKVAARNLARQLRVPPRSVRVVGIPRMPLLPSGKIDYHAIAELAEED